ncbi:MAG: F0F1 ATP synthase subunit alpha, partial [Chloroflexi bacterium]|nr:F0F1 ATP synthase subunit alpha [Chloroflexota bacterium]
AMKKVAGGLRLDLAQYNELKAFAQFGSDLDKSTRDRLERGQRVTEILKQPQYRPMPVEQQVMIIYAVSNGFLDDIPIDKMQAAEANFHLFMSSNHPDIGQVIAETGSIADENALKAAIEEWKRSSAF